MSQHTPGPWHWEDSTHPQHKRLREKGRKALPGVAFARELVAGTQWVMESGADFGAHDGNCGPFDLVIATEADAILIEAAPDLLEACKKALAYIEAFGNHSCDDDSTVSEGDYLDTVLRAAIAKATGDTCQMPDDDWHARAREAAKAARKLCRCPEYAGEDEACPVHGKREVTP